jgi:P-type Cu+ transporter
MSNSAGSPDTFFVTLQPRPNEEDLELIGDILQARDVDAEVFCEESRLRLVTAQHPADVLLRLTDIGFQAELEEMDADPTLRQLEETRMEIRRSWRRALLAGIVGFGIMVGDMAGFFPQLPEGRLFWTLTALVCVLVMYCCGRTYFIGAWKQLRHRSANMDTLVALGTGAAWLSSVIVIADPAYLPAAGNHLYLDASVMILAFLQLGRVLETWANRTTHKAIGALVGLRVRTARVFRAAGEVEVPVSLLRIGDQIRVRPGQKVPIDGVIISGSTTIDESMLTGEPLSVKRQTGDAVTGGTMNRSGTFTLRVTRLDGETTLARIIKLVREAQMSKPPIGRLVDRIAAIFVPVVILISIAAFSYWITMGPEPRLAFALTTAIAVLVIACPWTLGLATPIAIMVGTSRAAQNNVIIRNSDALQTAATLSHVVVDKTGTLTEGRPSISAVFPVAGLTEQDVLQWAASLESTSEHPLAEAVLTAQQQTGAALIDLENFKPVAGRGVRAEQGETTFFLGNDHFLSEQGLVLPEELAAEAKRQAGEGGTPVWLGEKRRVLGLLIVKDPVRTDAGHAIHTLRGMGITVVMCTGDNRITAEAVARQLGIDIVHSELLPEEKLDVVRTLQEQGGKVGMVGDGVNDAPALAKADTGFALGSGTDVAIENADITLNGDSLLLVAHAIAISGATIRIIRQNLLGAFIYNVTGIPLAAGLLYPFTGWLLDPMFASAAMALSSVTVIANANRLRFFRLG